MWQHLGAQFAALHPKDYKEKELLKGDYDYVTMSYYISYKLYES